MSRRMEIALGLTVRMHPHKSDTVCVAFAALGYAKRLDADDSFLPPSEREERAEIIRQGANAYYNEAGNRGIVWG